MAAKHVVIFVQGTFADGSGSGSLGPNSDFARKLRRRLGAGFNIPASRTKYSFKWSGANSEAEREDAAAALLKLIMKAEVDPAVEGYSFVGHSHGGTVVWLSLMLASQVMGLRLSKLKRWITVGTPFYSHGLRDGWPRKRSPRPLWELSAMAEFGDRWIGLNHSLDEAMGLLRTIQGVSVSRLPEVDAPLLQRLALGWGTWLVKSYATKTAFSTGSVGEVSFHPPLGTEKRKNRGKYLSDKASNELNRLSNLRFQMHGLAAYRNLRKQLADGRMKNWEIDLRDVSLTAFLIHCLYFESEQVLDLIAKSLRPSLRGRNQSSDWICEAEEFSRELASRAGRRIGRKIQA